MGQTLGTNLNTMLTNGGYDVQFVLDITLSDASVLRYGTDNLTVDGNSYVNLIQSVGEIRRSLESATNAVGISLANTDQFFSEHFTANRDKWRGATAVLRRVTIDKKNRGLANEVRQIFSGRVNQMQPDDLNFTFNIVTRAIADGLAVATRTCGGLCPLKFKSPPCGYSGGLTVCDKHLLSGCAAADRQHRFQGTETKYPVDQAAPGSAIGGGGDYDNCPEENQWTTIKRDGERMDVQVKDLKLTDLLRNPITGNFCGIAELTRHTFTPLFKVRASNGAESISSYSHPIIKYIEDETGTKASAVTIGNPVLTALGNILEGATAATVSADMNWGTVVKIKMSTEHIYAAGTDAGKQIVAHNSKDPTELMPEIG